MLYYKEVIQVEVILDVLTIVIFLDSYQVEGIESTHLEIQYDLLYSNILLSSNFITLKK